MLVASAKAAVVTKKPAMHVASAKAKATGVAKRPAMHVASAKAKATGEEEGELQANPPKLYKKPSMKRPASASDPVEEKEEKEEEEVNDQEEEEEEGNEEEEEELDEEGKPKITRNDRNRHHTAMKDPCVPEE
eukprot:15172108-Alexandrium_andersonii.AAC.1